MQTLPYGSWPSPISAADLVRGSRQLSAPTFVGEEVWWGESRPEEGGRTVVVRRGAGGSSTDVFPGGWNVRSRVHEYGGTCWVAVPAAAGHALVFTNFPDQRIWRLDPGSSDPTPLTPEPAEPAALRYADPIPAGAETLWVREAHAGGRIHRHIVAVPTDGSGAGDPSRIREVAGDSHFLAFPRVSPDGTKLAWIAWDHPQMPWDGTRLVVADLVGGVATEPRTLLGSTTESVLQPEWVNDQSLYVVSDRSGWWNLYRVEIVGDGNPVALYQANEEFAGPLWTLGESSYAVLDDGRLLVRHGTDVDRFGILDPDAKTVRDSELPYTVLDGPHVRGEDVLTVAASPTAPSSIVRISLAGGTAELLRTSTDDVPDAAWLPVPQAITVEGVGGRDVHANIYPPTSPETHGPDGELPPYLAVVHGGPTSHADAGLNLSVAYFTSRGIGVALVNYGGSTGYGREYRDRLRGQWGVVDVEDTVSVMESLVGSGQADPRRLAIRGGSAGGWTTLAALTRTDIFGAGASYFGVAELVSFVADTHDFESRYVDGLVGPLPGARALYDERAPLSHVDDVSCPVLLLQGDEDEIVPPSQAEMFRDALVRKGILHAYLLFAGEQHGFRKAENIIAATEAELSFYGQVFGFTPSGVPVLALTTG